MRKRQVDKRIPQLGFENNDKSEMYKVEAIYNSAVYTKKSKSGQSPGLYHLISWKNFLEEENT